MANINRIKAMAIDSERMNRKAFDRLTKLMPYERNTIKRIIKRNASADYCSDAFDINMMLSLGVDERLFIPIPETMDTDFGYQKYLEYISAMTRYAELAGIMGIEGDKTDKRHYQNKMKVSAYKLDSYEVYKSGKVQIKKQNTKLFKYLLKEGIFTKDMVDMLNTMRTGNKGLFLCISRNPVDMLFCSTNQSYGSCLNCESDYESAYYFALPAMSLDTNRAIAFVTDGKLHEHKIGHIKFKHFKYVQRSWLIALQSKDNPSNKWFHCIKAYPSKRISIVKTVNQSGLVSLPLDGRYDDAESIHQFPYGEYSDGDRAMIYLDTIGINYDGRYDSYQSSGADSPFDYCDGMNNYIDNDLDFDDLNESDRRYCECCGDRVDYDYAYFNDDGECFCESCYSETYCYCESCSCETHYDYAMEADGQYYCESCFNEQYVQCEYCGGAIDRDFALYTVDGEAYCERCFDNHCYQCDDCGEIHSINDSSVETSDGQTLCLDCVDNNHFLCDDCMTYCPDIERSTDFDCLCDDCADSRKSKETLFSNAA